MPHDDAYRGLKHYIVLRQWDQGKIQAMIGGLQFMHNGVMPPFAGTDAEKGALAAFLAPLRRFLPRRPVVTDGKTVFQQNCGMCHEGVTRDVLFKACRMIPMLQREALKDLARLVSLDARPEAH